MLESQKSPAQIVEQNATRLKNSLKNNDKIALTSTLHHDICIQVPIQLLHRMLMVTKQIAKNCVLIIPLSLLSIPVTGT